MARFVPPGYQSARATRVFVGDGVPASTLGNINDWYKDNLTGDLYQKAEDDVTWNVIGSVSGGGGSGEGFIVLHGSGAPTNGVAGTGVGEADTGSQYIDDDTNTIYIQLGELDNVNWLPLISP